MLKVRTKQQANRIVYLFCRVSNLLPSFPCTGTCVNNKCVCSLGFTGPDCSVPFKKCLDGERECFNGSECVRNNERDSKTQQYKYHCDCSAAFDRSSFAGIQCEYAATKICEKSVSVSNYAFCTNGGECLDLVSRGQPHAGCKCGPDFEGRHCQYLKGTAPPEELELVNVDEGAGMSSVAVFFMVVVSLGAVGILAFLVYKRRTAGKESTNPESSPEIQVVNTPSLSII